MIDAWSKIVGDFVAAHAAPVALREGILYFRVIQPALHYELEQIFKIEILRKLKQCFGSKTIRDVRFRGGLSSSHRFFAPFRPFGAEANAKNSARFRELRGVNFG